MFSPSGHLARQVMGCSLARQWRNPQLDHGSGLRVCVLSVLYFTSSKHCVRACPAERRGKETFSTVTENRKRWCESVAEGQSVAPIVECCV